MADVQRQFEQFHESVRVDYDMSAELREKRDIVVDKVRKYLRDEGLPAVSPLLQGSYKMKTGVKPVAELEYDIDIGLRFDFDDTAYAAADVRGWVYEAVKDHTDRCEDKGPCVRVVYQAGYHLDLVTYCVWTDPLGRDQYRLAHSQDGWLPADPPALLAHVDRHRQPFAGTEDGATKTDQFRRCVRALRRWNDVRTPREDPEKPTGLAFVLLCCERLPVRRFLDERPDDRRALEDLARGASSLIGRITASKPTPQFEDMFGRIGDVEMARLKRDLGRLASVLAEAGAAVDPTDACRRLQGEFGDDFPVPNAGETAVRTSAPAITRSSVSA